MPLTAKGEGVLQKMKEEYGDKKGEEVFYAKINSGDKEAQDWHEKDKPEKNKPEKKKPQTIMGDRNIKTKTAAEMRKKQGPGMWQGDIGE